MNCRPCSDTMFRVLSDREMSYSGRTSKQLGITQGDCLNLVLDKIVETLETLIKENPCKNDRFNSLSFTPTPTTTSSFPIETKNTSSGVQVTYSLDGALSRGESIRSTSINVIGKSNGLSKVITNTDKPTGGLVVPTENLPATFDVEMVVNTDSGEKILKSTFQVNAEEKQKEVLIEELKRQSTVSAESQEEYNSIVLQEIEKLQTKVAAITRAIK